MNKNRTLVTVIAPATLGVAAQIIALQQAFGITGSLRVGVLYLSFLFFIPASYMIGRFFVSVSKRKLRHTTYDHFLDCYLETASEITVLSSGCEQLSNYLESFVHYPSKRLPDITIYMRHRSDAAVLNERVARIQKACSKLSIKLRMFSSDWNAMMLSAVVVDNRHAIFGFYTKGNDFVARVGTKYVYASRARCDIDDWLFLIYDKWSQECTETYKPLP